MATQNGSGRGRDLPRTSKHLQFRNELPFPYRSAALAWLVEPFLKCGLPDRKEAGLSAPRIASFSVWGTVGCPSFCFAQNWIVGTFLPLMSLGVCQLRPVLRGCLRKYKEMVSGSGCKKGLSGPRSVRRFKSSHFSQEKSAGFTTQLFSGTLIARGNLEF